MDEEHKETEHTVPCVSAICNTYQEKEILLPEPHRDIHSNLHYKLQENLKKKKADKNNKTHVYQMKQRQ